MKKNLVTLLLAGGASLFATAAAADCPPDPDALCDTETVLSAATRDAVEITCSNGELDCVLICGDDCAEATATKGSRIRPPTELIDKWTHYTPVKTLTFRVQHAGGEYIYVMSLDRFSGITGDSMDEVYAKQRFSTVNAVSAVGP